MSFVYKQLTTADTVVTPFAVNKGFSFQGKSQLLSSTVNIDVFRGTLPTQSLFNSQSFSSTGYYNNQFEDLVFKSIEHLYFSNYLTKSSGDNVATASFNIDGTISGEENTTNNYNFLSNTLIPNRSFPTSSNILGVISIPSDIFGEYVSPGTFELSNGIARFYDDKNGNVLFDRPTGQDQHVGNIIYEHGIIIFTEPTASHNPQYNIANYSLDYYGYELTLDELLSDSNLSCSFSSSTTIYETQFICKLRESEYNFSTNPTLISGSNGEPYHYVSSSYFTPYITAVGLYNQDYELIAVGKLAQPVLKSDINDTNIIVNLDMF